MSHGCQLKLSCLLLLQLVMGLLVCNVLHHKNQFEWHLSYLDRWFKLLVSFWNICLRIEKMGVLKRHSSWNLFSFWCLLFEALKHYQNKHNLKNRGISVFVGFSCVICHFEKKKTYFLCINIFACMYHVCLWYLKRLERVLDWGNGLEVVLSQYCVCWEPNPNDLKTEKSL